MKCRIIFNAQKNFLHVASSLWFACNLMRFFDVFMELTFKQPTQTGPVTWEGPIMSGASRKIISPGFMFRVATK